MAKYIIEGGKKLSGTIKISGNKNSVLPCIAASLLTCDEVTLTNAPDIVDVRVFLEILQKIGVSTHFEKNILKIKAEKVTTTDLPKDLLKKLRASLLLAGPMLARKGKVNFTHPGGDIIGIRTITPHIESFKELGFKVIRNDQDYKAWGKKTASDITIFLEEASVTATENVILASVLGEGTTTIKNATSEPHVQDLCNLLIGMGAKISGVGSNMLKIEGVKALGGTTFQIGSEHLEIGTYAVAAAITGGEITMTNITEMDLDPILFPLKKMGVNFKKNNDSITISAKNLVAIPKLHTNIWPGFPTDLMSVFIVLASQAKGVSLMHDWMFESRMFFVDKLISMGANITIADPHRVVVYGATKLVARELETPDIRAGMALLLAALIAKGTSTINEAELIERGYEDVLGKLNVLGANITRES